ncbi:hypothetical protein K7432_012145 [Basidiobolus ranarum]|uniref:RING-type domain-containing protein n=1 Tax=Basidiobolus ranarum TaxID=34480 RepID=A0ABR2VSQ9_9FUNG
MVWRLQHCWLVTLLAFLILHHQSLVSPAPLFSDRKPSIIQEVVYVLVNSSSFKQDKTSKTVEYLKDIFFLPDSPAPPSEGLQGILYSQADSCVQSQASLISNAPENVTHIKHIALLSLNDCTMEWKINRAQDDLAIGAIIYDNQPIDVENLKLPASISIPVVIVTKEVGERLYNDLMNIDSASTPVNTTSHWKRYLNLTIIPYGKFQPGVWELTIIIGLALIICSVILFVIIRYRRRYLKKNSTHHTAFIGTSETLVLQKIHLEDFPVRSWRRNDNPSHMGDDASQPMVMLTKLEPKNVNIPEESSNNVNYLSGSPVIQLRTASQTPLLDRISGDESAIHPVCSVCLDDFRDGDQVRRLPCQHDFHTKCVDMWLTSKSNKCPLCKVDARPRNLLNNNSSGVEKNKRWYHINRFDYLPFTKRRR